MLPVLLAYLAVVGVKLAAGGGDITRFIVAGDHFVTRSQLPFPIAVEPRSDGYDGQFFFRLALDPASTAPVADGIVMRQHPAVRAQRIVYPALAWGLSLGQARAVPYALVAVNLLALAAIAAMAGRLAARAGLPPRLGLLLPFYPGFVLSLGRDTAEIVATALALGALLAADGRRWPIAALLAGAAVLTRESTLLYLAGYGLVALAAAVRRRAFDPRIAWCLVPPAVYLMWQAVLLRRWGGYGFDVVGHDDLAGLPVVAWARAVAGYGAALIVPPLRFSVLYSLVACLAIAAFVGVVAVQAARARPLVPALLIPFGLYAVMAAFFTEAIWRDAWGYVRIGGDLYAIGIAVLIAQRRRAALRRLAPLVAVLWGATVVFSL